jgi:hypothetical protein
MLEMIFSEWIVRVFLVYLLIVGVATLLRRDRSTPSLHLALLFLPIFAEKWGRRWANDAFFRARLADNRIVCGQGDGRSGFHAWEESGGAGLRYI